jgi:uncharacterized protein (DUF983 family)
MKKFCCPNCQKRILFKHIWFLSNKTVLNCNNCGRNLKPQKMSDLFFVIAFAFTAIPGLYFAKLSHSLFKGLFIGFLCGLTAYFALIFYAFLTVKFEEV